MGSTQRPINAGTKGYTILIAALLALDLLYLFLTRPEKKRKGETGSTPKFQTDTLPQIAGAGAGVWGMRVCLGV